MVKGGGGGSASADHGDLCRPWPPSVGEAFLGVMIIIARRRGLPRGGSQPHAQPSPPGPIPHPSRYIDDPDINGRSSLHWAVRNGHVAIMNLLIQVGWG